MYIYLFVPGFFGSPPYPSHHCSPPHFYHCIFFLFRQNVSHSSSTGHWLLLNFLPRHNVFTFLQLVTVSYIILQQDLFPSLPFISNWSTKSPRTSYGFNQSKDHMLQQRSSMTCSVEASQACVKDFSSLHVLSIP